MNGRYDAPDGDALVIHWQLDHPPDRVWKALTDPDLLNDWLGRNDRRPELGACFAIGVPADLGSPVECKVLEAIPNRVLRITWRGANAGEADAPPLDTAITFVLDEHAEGGTRLHVIPEGLGTKASAAETAREGRRPVSVGVPLRPVQPPHRPHRPKVAWAGAHQQVQLAR
jgi:uncharacterized protein YndB with AHSA1/START domain